MGILGLTTYINNRSDRYLRYYELHDTYLVIDGNSVCCQIYSLYTKSNCAFGGDYDSYARAVSKFFEDLSRCRVTPLVLIDGGTEDKKLKTIVKRTKEKIQRASAFSPVDQRGTKFMPLLQKEVFTDILREKNIRHVQCPFEADNDIAAIARILNCPVLSYDSDFYIYGSLYIPFNTLDNCIVRHSSGAGYVKRCKIYKVEYLLNSFRGLHESMLPLAAILLGNDYVKPRTFNNFFRHLKLRGASKKRHNERQCRIEATFRWLSSYTLDKAIIGILTRLPKPWRQNLLNLIEENINSYTKASAEILVPLGFPRDYIARVNPHHVNRSFKFDGDINTLTYIEEACEGEEDEMSDEEDDYEIELMSTVDETEKLSQNKAISNLPKWFVNEFSMAKLPPYFMNMIVRRLYVCPVQIEHKLYSSSNVISLKMISVIFGLLKSAINDNVRYMRYMIRDQNRIIKCELQGTETLNGCKLPSLCNLRDMPLIVRREILNETLGINFADRIHELPPEWMLYFGCIKYWIKEQQPSVFHKSNVYALLIGMMFHIMDSKVGIYRNIEKFVRKNNQIIVIVKQKRIANNYTSHYTLDGTVIEAYNEINYEDCLLATPFFISHFKLDAKLYSNPKAFNRSIVHAFAEFQNCLRHALDLNSLLGNPYPRTVVATFFNGTLLYNLSDNFKTHQDIERYINTVLGMSPSLLKLFHILLSKIKSAFPSLFQNEVNPSKRRKKVKGRKTKNDDSDTEYFSADDDLDEACYDANNSYSILNYV